MPNFYKAYFSIVRFVPDFARGEGANIGIVLLCPELHFLDCKLVSGNDRIRRFFSTELSESIEQVNMLKEEFAGRVERASEEISSLADFEQFVATRANCFQLTPPKFVKTNDPEADLTQLFSRMVGGRERQASTPRSAQRLCKGFANRIERRGLLDVVQRNVVIESPTLERPLEFPFGFQNGQQNVIQAVTFTKTLRTNEERACALMIEAMDLQDRTDKVQLNVIAAFPDATDSSRTERLLGERGIQVYDEAQMEALVDVIAQTAH